MAKIGLKKAYIKQKDRFFIVEGKKHTIKELRAKGVEFIIGNGLSGYFDIEYTDAEYKKMGIISPNEQKKAAKSEVLTGKLNTEKGKVTKATTALGKLTDVDEDKQDKVKIEKAKEKLDEATKLRDDAEKVLKEFVEN